MNILKRKKEIIVLENMKMNIGATNSNGTKKPMYHYVEVTNDIIELLENILKEDLETAKGSMPWNSHDFETIDDVEEHYGLQYMFHDTADYHDNVDELLVKLENGITITGVWGDNYEYDINE